MVIHGYARSGLGRSAVYGLFVLVLLAIGVSARAAESRVVVERGLRWLAEQQTRQGAWDAKGRYPTAMTALAGLALLSEGSTPAGGRYSPQLRRAVDYLTRQARPNGLIGDPLRDDRYTYGHGFAMLFLSQVLGEEDDAERREQLVTVLSAAVRFTGEAQTAAGGWGYVSASDGAGFDEGSTTVTQVQGLRGCRNAGIPTQKEVIDGAVGYIHRCTLPEGGVQYSSKGGGGRPAITAAAIATLYNAGEYDDDFVPRMQKYCRERLGDGQGGSLGHWHYAHFYYSQVRYREGGDSWIAYRDWLAQRLSAEATRVNTTRGPGCYWSQGYIGAVYTTSLNLVMMQLDNDCLPIFQR